MDYALRMPTRKPTSESSPLRADGHSPRGIFGGNQGKSSRTPTSDRPRPPLYDVLLKIGRVEKSIEPERLMGHTALLESPEVRRRAGNSKDPGVLAKYANEALHDLVNAIAEPTRRVVAQAALCTKKIYEGLRVGERQEMLEKSPGMIDKDMFKYYRELALKSIAETLEADDVEPGEALPIREFHSSSSQDDDGLSGIPTHLARPAANLHYSMLTAMFIADFSEKYNLIDYRPDRFEAWDAYSRRAFESFTDFVSTYSHTLEHHDRDGLLLWFSPDVLDKLILLLSEVRKEGPPFTDVERETLWKHLEDWKLSVDYRKVDSVFRRTWRIWFYADPHGSVPAVSRLEPISAQAGAAALTCIRQIALSAPVLSEARAIAHKTLAYYYDFDESTNLFDGRSLRHHADSYFDSTSLRLANLGLV
jgi:hypothetical protein